MEVIDTADAAADGKGYVDFFRHGPDDIDKDMTFFVGGGNIVENEFVRHLIGVEFPQLHRVVYVLYVLKLFALDDASVAHIEAWYNPFCQHLLSPQTSDLFHRDPAFVQGFACNGPVDAHILQRLQIFYAADAA